MSFEDPDLDLHTVYEALAKVTSPSTVKADFKTKIESNPGFFEAGLALHMEHPDECPFCTQPMQGAAVAAIDMYVQYFQDEEAREKNYLKKLIRQIDAAITKTQQCRTQHLREKSIYDELRAYFPSFAGKGLDDPLELLDNIVGYLSALRECVLAKQEDLTKSVDGPTDDITLHRHWSPVDNRKK